MMADKTTMGINRTGAAASPRQSKQLHEASAAIKRPSVDGKAIIKVRRSYVDGGTLGSIPPPTTLRGLGKTLVELLKGARAPALMDRLSERLCSERSAVRLYEGLIAKHESMGGWTGGPERHDLERLRAEEMQNYERLHRHIESLGADPTAMTPAADVAGVTLMGVPQVIADPRTDLRQCIEAMLVAELADNAYWESLAGLALQMGHEEMAGSFHAALANEARHLSLLRSWVASGLSTSAGLHPTGEKAWGRQKGNGERRRTAKPRASTTQTTRRRGRARQ